MIYLPFNIRLLWCRAPDCDFGIAKRHNRIPARFTHKVSTVGICGVSFGRLFLFEKELRKQLRKKLQETRIESLSLDLSRMETSEKKSKSKTPEIATKRKSIKIEEKAVVENGANQDSQKMVYANKEDDLDDRQPRPKRSRTDSNKETAVEVREETHRPVSVPKPKPKPASPAKNATNLSWNLGSK